MMNIRGWSITFLLIMCWFIAACSGGEEPEQEEPAQVKTVTVIESEGEVEQEEEEIGAVESEEGEETPSQEEIVEEVTVEVTEEIDIDELLGDLEPLNLSMLGENGNCIARPDGSGFTSEGGGFTSEGGGFGLIHGELVWNTITQTLTTLGFEATTESAAGDAVHLLVIDQFSEIEEAAVDRNQTWSDSTGLNIQLVAVDIKEFDTNSVASKTQSKMQDLITDGASKFVLNMSWIVLPCNLIFPANIDEYVNAVCQIEDPEDLEAVEGLNEISDFLDSFSDGEEEVFCADAASGEVVLVESRASRWLQYWLTQDNTSEAISSWEEGLNDDPFITFLDCFSIEGYLQDACQLEISTPDEFDVISVAAAGNESDRAADIIIPYPLFPGVRTNVLSVSALEGEIMANKSNDGEVAMNGLYLTKEDLGGYTSFAAPRMSTLAAIYLGRVGIVPCEDREDIFPPLGYNSEDPSRAFDNLPLDEAVFQYCMDFLS